MILRSNYCNFKGKVVVLAKLYLFICFLKLLYGTTRRSPKLEIHDAKENYDNSKRGTNKPNCKVVFASSQNFWRYPRIYIYWEIILISNNFVYRWYCWLFRKFRERPFHENLWKHVFYFWDTRPSARFFGSKKMKQFFSWL